eukprot:Platyproteum_vivax@DN511_c0_g1_i1.p1
MLNFIPKRCPSVSLLYGKRPVQRIQVGTGRHTLEIPLNVVDTLYNKVDASTNLHNNDYNPLQWKDFATLKLAAAHLHEASKSSEATRSALTDLDWYPTIASVYSGHKTITELDVADKLTNIKLRYPVQGKNV